MVQKQWANTLANYCWQVQLASILANNFRQFFCDGKHVFQPINKMADEREATFKFIEDVHICPAVWDVSSQSSVQKYR